VIVNIIDRRKRPYRFLTVNAIVEAAWHDNRCLDSDRVDDKSGPNYDEREHIPLADAITWAGTFDGSVTLYIYDQDSGIYVEDRERMQEAQ
jgi:hypothetical protein